MTSDPGTIEIPPKSKHLYSIIWLHGLGADGHDFEGISHEMNLTAGDFIRFIFPNAPFQSVTVNAGMEMRAWYDILEMSLEHRVDIAGIYQSAKLVESLIEREINKGIPSQNIMLAGFSQGGVIALHLGLRYAHKLAGIIALSANLPTIEQLKTERSTANQTTPIFMAHGILDSVVDIEKGKTVFDALHAMKYDIIWHDYVMEHSVCVEELEHLSSFINNIFIPS
jgi:phospholipase/carboxylesterase